MKKKGQAATEFLMTYGWAILVVLLVVGALAYFGVTKSSTMLPERTVFQAPLSNVDNAVISLSQQTISIAFMNSKSVGISIPRTGTFTSKECTGPGQIINVTDKQQAEIQSNIQIPPNTVFIITWRCVPVSGLKIGSKFQADITFDYTNIETSQSMKQSGSIEGKYI